MGAFLRAFLVFVFYSVLVGFATAGLVVAAVLLHAGHCRGCGNS